MKGEGNVKIHELTEIEKGCFTCELPADACNSDSRCSFVQISRSRSQKSYQKTTGGKARVPSPRRPYHQKRYQIQKRQQATEQRIARKSQAAGVR